jgi:predicted ribonuclease YlaK
MFGQASLEAEIAERKELFTTAFQTLQKALNAWSVPNDTELAVVDTSVFLSHPSWTRDPDPKKVIASIPWAEELLLVYTEVLLVLPEVVIKELDRLKESGNVQTRYRARVTLAVIDSLLTDPYGTVRIQHRDSDWRERDEQGEPWRGGVQLKVLYNDSTYRSPGDEDSEIIDKTLAVQTLAGKPVHLITMDTTMGLNARREQLKVTKPAREIEELPVEGGSTRVRRRDTVDTAGSDRVPVGRQP